MSLLLHTHTTASQPFCLGLDPDRTRAPLASSLIDLSSLQVCSTSTFPIKAISLSHCLQIHIVLCQRTKGRERDVRRRKGPPWSFHISGSPRVGLWTFMTLDKSSDLFIYFTVFYQDKNISVIFIFSDFWKGCGIFKQFLHYLKFFMGFPCASDDKESACNAGHLASIPGSGRSPGGRQNGYPLRYSCLENPTDRGAWQATVHAVTKSRTWLSDSHFTLQRDAALYATQIRPCSLNTFPLPQQTCLCPLPAPPISHRLTGKPRTENVCSGAGKLMPSHCLCDKALIREHARSHCWSRRVTFYSWLPAVLPSLLCTLRGILRSSSKSIPSAIFHH